MTYRNYSRSIIQVQDGPETQFSQQGVDREKHDAKTSVAVVCEDLNINRHDLASSGDAAGLEENRVHGEKNRNFLRNGTRRLPIIVAVIVLSLVAIVVGVGVSKGLKHHTAAASAASTGSGPEIQPSAGASPPVDVPTTPVDAGDTGSVQVLSNTGIASLAAADGSGLLLYYQSLNGSLYEDLHSMEDVSLDSLRQAALGTKQPRPRRTILNTLDVAPASPLAAVSYMADGQMKRQLFYFDKQDRLRTIAAGSANGTWSNSSLVHDTPGPSTSKSMTACYEPNLGIQIFYAIAGDDHFLRLHSSPGNGSQWQDISSLPGIHSSAGIACGIAHPPTGDQSWMSVYAQNTTSADAVHYSWPVSGPSSGITPLGSINDTAPAASFMGMANASSIAMAINPNATVSYVFYQGPDGRLRRLTANPANYSSISEFRSGEISAINGSKLATAWPNALESEGPVVFYQSAATELRYTVFGHDGAILVNGTV